MPAPSYAREIPQRYRLEAARCAGCKKLAFPPRRICPSCHGESFETVTLSGEGQLLTWTVIHVAPGDFAVQAPYVVGIVELDEGVRITAQIADCNAENLEFGTKVRHVLRRLRAEGEDGILQYGYKFVPSIT